MARITKRDVKKGIIRTRRVANYQRIDVKRNDRLDITRSPDGLRLPGHSESNVDTLRKTDSKDTRRRDREERTTGAGEGRGGEGRECTRRLRKLSRRCVFTRRFTSGQRAFDLHARAPVATLKRLKGFSRGEICNRMRQDPSDASTGRRRARCVRTSRASVNICKHARQ